VLTRKRVQDDQLARRFVYSIFLGMAITFASLAVAAPQQNRSYDRLEDVANLIRQGKLTLAEAELEAILQKQPHEANAINLLGVVQAQQQRVVQAEQLFLRALKESPRLVGAYVNLGRLYLDQKKPERALWAYSEAIRLAPDDPNINYNLASLYEERHDFERALAYMEKIPRATWGVAELYLITKCYLGLGRTGEALSLITPLKQPGMLKPEEAAGFAAAFLKKDLIDDAIGLLEGARQNEPNSFVLLYQLGAAHVQKKDWSPADKFYSDALALKPESVPVLRALARVARARRELEKALSYLVRARKLAPDAPMVLYDFAVAAFSMNLILDALPVAEELYRQNPSDASYVHLLAVTRFRHDEKAQAESLLRRYIELRPKDWLGYYLLGVTLYTVKRYSEARRTFEQSLAFGPSADSQYMLGLIADTEGDTVAALRWLQPLVKTSPSHAAAHTLLGIVYAERNDVAAARNMLERAAQLNPKDLRAHYQLGLVYAKLGEKERAQQMFAIADRLREEQRNQEVVSFKLIDPPE
jgi:Flp pilus assembly protein TadD